MDTKTKAEPRKKELIIAYHGVYKPTTIARLINCSREYVYIVWKNCGLELVDTSDS